MKKRYISIIILQAIFAIIIVSCKDKNKETELYNIFINGSYSNINSSEEYIIKNKPYKIKKYPFHILIDEKEKCYEGEKWHEAMTSFDGGIIIFGEEITILTEKYYKPKTHPLWIIDKNGNLLTENGEIIGNNVKIRIIKDKVEIQYYNSDNELTKQLFEIEDLP